MKPKTTTEVIAHGAALVLGGGALAAGVQEGIHHSFLQSLAPILQQIIAAAVPIAIAFVTRGPGQIKQ